MNYNNVKPTKASISLEGVSKAVDPNSLYLVDFSKMNSVNDLVVILAAMSIAFPGNHPHFEAVKPFLNFDNPINIPNQQQPEAKEIKMPKLKKL